MNVKIEFNPENKSTMKSVLNNIADLSKGITGPFKVEIIISANFK